ncbi:histidine triad nucleotide-binding protein [Salinibacterium sp. UTAS2018]|uniref:histidine triad nucleotide-binding protein n=1 Tax=Salinibacterium sp. UTAS2018 TaxID=2508880 RepID=UPI001009843B|nr:histidine triad nucleotide-binding protein [Salinibacterium sp. UTAS2018]QAV69625.1 histidine triad nucleotide-binding protein [Salinibacterium sp. UTAS2018]
MSDSPSIFTKIIAREIPADIVFESDAVIAFRDIAPQAPVHLLVVPKTEEFANVTELAAGNPALLAELVSVAQKLADEHAGGQYRLIFNTGENAGQTVFHVHAHVLGGNLEEGTLGH